MASVQEASSNGNGRRRVLVFPLPFQGHINPMLQLADVLHSRGLAITVLHTRFNALDPALHPEFAFVAVPDGIPADVLASGSVPSIILAMNAAMEASGAVRDVLVSMLADAACLFIDANLLAVQRAASALGLPTVVLRTARAACSTCFLAYPMLHHKGYLPPKRIAALHAGGGVAAAACQGPILLKPQQPGDDAPSSGQIHRKTVRNSHGLVINTFDALEPAELDRIRGELDHVAFVLAAGPLHKLSTRSTGSRLLREDRSCIEWLDTQAVGSVLYVSFGSLASMDSGALSEVAWGLANSGHPFLWVVRHDFVRGSAGPGLPEGFDHAVEGRGKVIPWAPQQEVLAHSAVGGFWTHNGWNSTLESISEGLPMICRPQFADQMMNARYVEAAWGIGFELEGELERTKIEEAIRNLMKGSRGEEMRKRARELKKKVASCLGRGGSSLLAIDKLVEHMLSF